GRVARARGRAPALRGPYDVDGLRRVLRLDAAVARRRGRGRGARAGLAFLAPLRCASPERGAPMHEAPLLWAALLAYVRAVSTPTVAAALERRADRWILALLALGLALHGAALAARWAAVGHGPFITLFEILSSNVLSLTLVFALAYWRIPAVRPAAAFVMP